MARRGNEEDEMAIDLSMIVRSSPFFFYASNDQEFRMRKMFIPLVEEYDVQRCGSPAQTSPHRNLGDVSEIAGSSSIIASVG
nr:hypothetical protein CFP56_09801 [Quercus suber]